MKQGKSKTFSMVVDNGNGSKHILSLSWWQSLIAIAGTIAALFFGAARGAAWIGDTQIHLWFDKEGMPRIEQRIDEKLYTHTQEYEIRMQSLIHQLELQITELKKFNLADPAGD